jgi:hypothetical protein
MNEKAWHLDERQTAEIIALAQERQERPEDLVREAVARFLNGITRADEAAYQKRVAEVMANLKHPDQDHSMFGAWRGSGIDGVQYQKELRGSK